MIRTLSHSEIAIALDCQAKHAFAYTGRLTGGRALEPKTSTPLLRDGRAWGRAVAAFHQTGVGMKALHAALKADAAEQRKAGTFDQGVFDETFQRLGEMYNHYVANTARIELTDLEQELMIPIPSRSGRSSNRYRLHGFLDGVHRDDYGRYWIVEFKLRNRLHSDEQIALSRQIRWYAWAWRQATGEEPTGVIVDERLNAIPSAVRFNKDGSLSKVQSCTPQAYVQAAGNRGLKFDSDVVAGLKAKVWQKRMSILLRPGELDEAGWQLVSAARLVQQLDTGLLYPVRNPSPTRCPTCQFRDICEQPSDKALVNLLYRRVTPKAKRKVEPVPPFKLREAA